VNVISGVGVSGAAVELGSPTGTVSVGTGVLGMVAVGEAVQVGTSIEVGDSMGVVFKVRAGLAVGEGPICSPKVLTYMEIAVTQSVPITPMSEAMMAGSIPLRGFSLDLDIAVPVDEVWNSTASL
jgi:hypothetical protein